MVSDTVELRGHIIDSLLLPKVLDEIMTLGGTFEIVELAVGHRREDPSRATIRVSAPDADRLHIFIVSAAIGVAEGGRGRGRAGSRTCEITSVVRAFCSAPGGTSRDGCEITDGQIGARAGNLFVEPFLTDPSDLQQ